MKGKILLGCFLLSSCLFILTGCQKQVKQTVLAETKRMVSSQAETLPEVETDSTVISMENDKVIDSIDSSSVSSIKETKSTEEKELLSASTETSESKINQELPSTSVSEEVSQVQTPLPAEKVVENYQFSVSKNQTTETFIQLIGKDAQQIAWNEGLYASVMIAQAILETGSGNSQLARPPYHNLFGIKGSYQGKQVSFKTQEDKGNGQLYTIQSAFRQYPSYRESLEDYAALLKNGLSGNFRFYQETWKVNAATYQEAAKSLTGKYATDTSYDKKLIALIEAYKLTSYDQNPEISIETEREQPVNEPIQQEDSSEENQAVERSGESSEQELQINQTRQPIIFIPSTAQRPAKQLSGNQPVQ
ncbi:glucosaminidase domain-containing protein [Enterococcus pallens]|uniref:Mannosyl-glycoprotein endo-beta-N-acetylglucosamidase-like domain-containing protein n=1 Tax=Enterococcus pallens ATCC BAA-351 TaxID=1158607 RepID=R2QR82_9ENTE|nr:glucosaminidase domain-containing protein [Enterococcus pallens]EOH97733.1 hypothetical protein UAU_00401 [Enterococcus pallens ATCC BAA-351]EOU20848.1 hypothetical protein I588_01695 [Enterococcus pallens ATCC BAA-351]OJG70182.1 hypothetical protein RV10_GL000568 [Enterococcus pallens]